jgi:acetoin utilization deacetylase AcuC-like enzyme
MRVFFSSHHKYHHPKVFISKGQVVESPEKPQRADILEASARAAGHNLIEAEKHGLKPVEAVHDKDYICFLKNAWAEWELMPNSGKEIIPNIHPGRNMSALPQSVISLSGHYQADTACPIGHGTWEGIQTSSDVAVSGAMAIMQDTKNNIQNSFAYSLCRPPGHHAYSDQAGGFCFFNNSAIAAQYCRDHGAKKVAILDIDVHHGNGTQGIFYDRSDVMTVSLHGDPSTYYPFFAGYSDEIGIRKGEGFNFNYPMPKNTGDKAYLNTLKKAIDRISLYQPNVLIIALGLDASIDDPLAFLSITTEGFYKIGEIIGSSQVPTILIQEGGYISNVLGDNLIAVLKGFEQQRDI